MKMGLADEAKMTDKKPTPVKGKNSFTAEGRNPLGELLQNQWNSPNKAIRSPADPI